MRQLTAHAFITLPSTTAPETDTLIRKLIAQTEGPGGTPLPPSAQDAFADMVAAQRSLVTALPVVAEVKGPQLKDAHHAVQTSWSTLEQWLSAFTKLADHEDPRVPKAKQVHALLFGEGLGFANARVEVEWVTSDSKINALQQTHLAQEFEALGGKVFWTRVLAAHAAEGAAAHLTTATPGAVAALTQSDAKVAAQEAVREYVSAVIGTVRRKLPATQAAADALLRPLAEWTTHTAPAAAAATPAPAGVTPSP